MALSRRLLSLNPFFSLCALCDVSVRALKIHTLTQQADAAAFCVCVPHIAARLFQASQQLYFKIFLLQWILIPLTYAAAICCCCMRRVHRFWRHMTCSWDAAHVARKFFVSATHPFAWHLLLDYKFIFLVCGFIWRDALNDFLARLKLCLRLSSLWPR